MARPRKLPTELIRLRSDIKKVMKRKAKRKRMSLPDYLAWRLTNVK